ncbi:hypothetical protein B0H19DRAFT_1082374 [Mycena capillaripes]|nr:hypothetical protein B0H19DRAFT_1082374 [Mycena capillaripes]
MHSSDAKRSEGKAKELPHKRAYLPQRTMLTSTKRRKEDIPRDLGVPSAEEELEQNQTKSEAQIGSIKDQVWTVQPGYLWRMWLVKQECVPQEHKMKGGRSMEHKSRKEQWIREQPSGKHEMPVKHYAALYTTMQQIVAVMYLWRHYAAPYSAP